MSLKADDDSEDFITLDELEVGPVQFKSSNVTQIHYIHSKLFKNASKILN